MSAVVIIADLIMAGDQSGWELFSSAATPLRCGQDIEVPEIMLKVDFELGLLSTEVGHGARMLTPGPIMSGFRIPELSLLGPLEENAATIGAFLSPVIVPLKANVATGNYVSSGGSCDSILLIFNQDHSTPTGVFHRFSFPPSVNKSSGHAHHYLPSNVRVSERFGGFPVELLAVSENDGGAEFSVESTGADGEHPGSFVG
nr:hypothetical protein ACMD2_15541 [Ipomoea batatas]